MKKLNTSGTLQRVNFFFFLLPLFFISSLHTQTIPNEKLIEYYDRMYPWKPPEYNKQNDDTVLTVLGRWAWGPCHAVDVKGSYAYIGNGPTFHVLDIYD